MKWFVPVFLVFLLCCSLVFGQSGPGDLDGDGDVDIQDIMIVAGDIGKSSNFDSRADRNNDDVVNVFDLVLVAKYWGSNYGVDSLIEDSFEGYSVGLEPRAVNSSVWHYTAEGAQAGDDSSVLISDVLARSGTNSIAVTYDSVGVGEDDWAEQGWTVGSVSSGLEELWLEFWVYVPDDFVLRNYMGGNNKLFTAYGDDYYNAGRAKVVLEYFQRGGNPEEANLRFLTNPFGSGGSSESYTPSGWSEGVDTFPLITASGPWYRGRWNRLRVHVDVGSSSQDDGVFEVWAGDVLVGGWTGLPLWPDPVGEYHYPYFDSGYFMGWANTGFANTTVLYIDDVKFYDRDPGWGSSSDTTAPVRSNGQPSGTLASGIGSVTLSLVTDEVATCSYSASSGVSFSGMTQMSVTGGTSHSQVVSVSDGNSYAYNVKCQDSSGNTNSDDYTISFSVDSASGGSGGVLFYSDWSTATGQSDSALRDADKEDPWPTVICSNCDRAEVVDASTEGLTDWPSVNALRVNAIWRGNGAYFWHPRIDSLPVLKSGDDRYLRWYWNYNVPDEITAEGGSTSTHPIQDYKSGSAGYTNWMFASNANSDGTYNPHFSFYQNTVPGWPYNRWEPTSTFYKGQTYRWEMRQEVISNTEWRLWPRVYNSTGALIDDADSFYDIQGSKSLSEWYGEGNFLTWENLNTTNMFQMGLNGMGPHDSALQTYYPFVFAYQGALCIRSDTWCGAYGQLPGETLVVDGVPPVRSSGSPSGTLPAGSTSATLSLSTDESATCRYSSSAGTSYSSMSQMSSTGGTSHGHDVGVSDGQSYSYFVKCQDSIGNVNSDDYVISFSVDSSSSGGSGGVLFYSDWSTATGQSDSAILDAGKWYEALDNGNALEVVNAGSEGLLNWPTTNALKVKAIWRGDGAYAANPRANGLGVFNADEATRYYRWYFTLELPDDYMAAGGDGQQHPIQDARTGAAGQTNWDFWVRPQADGTFDGDWHQYAPWPNNRWSYFGLSKSTTYRFEMKMEWVSASEFRFYPRIYDASGTLLFNADGSGGATAMWNFEGDYTLQGWYDLGNAFEWENLGNTDHFQVGLNDLTDSVGSSYYPMIYSYQGAVCIRNDTWCGPYTGTY